MQRKITSIFLLILYFTVNVGYSLDLHFMDGKIMTACNEDVCVMDCSATSASNHKKHFSHSLQEHMEWMADNHQDSSGCSDHNIQIKIDSPQLDSKQELVTTPFLPVLFMANHLQLIPQLTEIKDYTSSNFIEIKTSSVPFYIYYQRLILYS